MTVHKSCLKIYVSNECNYITHMLNKLLEPIFYKKKNISVITYFQNATVLIRQSIFMSLFFI